MISLLLLSNFFPQSQVLGEATGAALGGLLVTQSAVPQVAPGLPKSSARALSTTQVHRDKELDVAKILLLLARWVHHTGQKQKKDVLSLYAQVRGLKPQWEKGYFSVAKYYDDLLVDARRRQDENQDGGGDSVSVWVVSLVQGVVIDVNFFITVPIGFI